MGAIVSKRWGLLPSQIYEAGFVIAFARVLPAYDTLFLIGDIPTTEIPHHSLSTSSVMNMATDSKLRSHSPKRLSKSLTASSATLIRLIAMRPWRRVRHHNVRVEWYRLPNRRQI